jgi:hypothetical protein
VKGRAADSLIVRDMGAMGSLISVSPMDQKRRRNESDTLR